MILGTEKNTVVVSGFIDMHVHLREPGNPEKETILTGTRAAMAGGYGLICAMPNVNPVPDSLGALKIQLEIIKKTASVKVLPYASVTKGRKGQEPTDYELLVPYVAGFSDDGSGVQDDDVMYRCMQGIAKCGGLLAAHCELLRNPQTGEPVENVGESEWREVERNIKFAKDTGCRLHICHVSTAESVALIRDGKRHGVRLTAETAPHYLVYNKDDISFHSISAAGGNLQNQPDGRFRMNPPIGTAADQRALIAAVQDGTIDVIATDHAPHTMEEKSRGFGCSLNGVVGLETAFPVLYTKLVKGGIISLERLLEMMSDAPARILGVENKATTYINLQEKYVIDASKFKSKGKSSPFDGMEVFGKIKNVKI